MKSPFAVISFMLTVLPLFGGEKDTAILRKFEMIATKDHLHTGVVRTNIPPANGSLADMLQMNSAVFVKYYGPSGLASVSMRGLGAQHTAVMWNGINLQSNMNSNFDLNLMPSFFTDNVALESGAGSGSCTNGALAGAVVLQNNIPDKNTVRGELLTGSFGQRMAGVSASYKLGKSLLRTAVLSRHAENDFTYRNVFLPGSPEEKMTHAEYRQNGLMQEWQHQSGKNSFYANMCLLDTRRELPDAMGSVTPARARQEDQNMFFVLRHVLTGKNGLIWTNRIFILGEKIDYYNNLISPAFNTAKTFQTDSELKLKFRKYMRFTGSVQISSQQAKADGYPTGRKRLLSSLYSEITRSGPHIQGLKWTFANRMMFTGADAFPMNPELGAEYKVLPFLLLKIHASVSSRIPSFNDLYWLPGGNPELRPERGKKAEFSAEFNRGHFKTAATVFRNRVSDWIIWLPAAGGIWTAVNAKQVDSRGVEYSAETGIKTAHLQYRIFARYQYVLSINTNAYPELQSSVGKQLFYTPRHTGFLQSEIIAWSWRLRGGMTYTGDRFATADNNPEHLLKAYILLHAAISKELKFRKHNFYLESGCNNLSDVRYQVVENRPMPGRQYYLKLTYLIKNEK